MKSLMPEFVHDTRLDEEMPTSANAHVGGCQDPSTIVSETQVKYCASVVGMHDETAEIRVFRLKPHDPTPLGLVAPGAHIDVFMPNGIVRQYSLCNGPTDRDELVIAVKREPFSRGGSAWMHCALLPGELVTIGAPRNHFRLRQSDAFSLLLAGGIGITPLIAMARSLESRRREFMLHYFARSPSEVAFRSAIDGGSLAAHACTHMALDATATRERLAAILAARNHVPLAASVYICGPAPFIDAALSLAGAWPADAVRVERFSALEQPAVPLANEEFVVELAISREAIVVPPHRSVLDALRDHGIVVPSMCEEGICGSCEVGVVAGDVDHRDSVLTPGERSEGHRMMICVSRARGRLVLDL